MKRGLIIGKFMPVHKGHMALIDFASLKCDELIVSMSYTDEDLIDHSIRFDWLKSIYNESKNILIEKVKDDFDNEMLPFEERMKLWAQFILKRFPRIDVVFSSETYGEPFGQNLGAESITFDLSRDEIPVSATKIRMQPAKYWDFIPKPARPYFVKKVCLYGPESTGKTEMARKLADFYKTEFVSEAAREMIKSNDFTSEDIIRIGHAQTNLIKKKSETANRLLICDTDLITTQIYSQYYLNLVPPILLQLENQIAYDQYFLFDIDVPWVPDGLRDLGDQRERMALIFKSELERRNLSYLCVKGSWEQRFETIRDEIDSLLEL